MKKHATTPVFLLAVFALAFAAISFSTAKKTTKAPDKHVVTMAEINQLRVNFVNHQKNKTLNIMNVDERWNAELVVQMLSQPGVQYCNDSPGALDDGTVVRILTGLDKDKRLIDEEFQERIKQQASDIKIWWKKKFNLSSNDPIYLTATEEQIYEDFVEHLVGSYIEEYAGDPIKEEIERNRLLNPNYDKEINDQLQKMLKQGVKVVNI